MESRAFHALELPRVLEFLAGFTVSDAGFHACLSLRPYSSLEETVRQTMLFEQGRLWLLRTQTRLAYFPVIDELLLFASGSAAVLDREDLFALRQLLQQGRQLSEAILGEEQSGDSSSWPLWTARCQELALPVKSISALGRCLAEDGSIRDDASPELARVRGELRGLHQQCTRKVKDYAVEYNILHFLQDSFMTLSSDRYVLPLKTNFKGRLQGVIHDYSQTGETCYFEPMFLVELNNRLQNLKKEEREEERKIFLYLSELIREEMPGVRAVYAFLVELDLLSARAGLAECYDGRMVEFAQRRGILLREARHPLLALTSSEKGRKALHYFEFKKQALFLSGAVASEERTPADSERPSGGLSDDSQKNRSRISAGGVNQPGDGHDRAPAGASRVVPSTLELLPGQKALIISGGNAGGKTVCLKTLGLISLMSLCALPVPVESGSVLPPWSRIDAFIGDEQSLEDHVSTFTAQIQHLGRIWTKLSSESLVILDEFGAGTDPTQGAALAQAVVDSLMECGSYVAAATHFPALKAYALSTEGVRAASVLFDPSSKRPLFRLVYDQVGASQALDVAREHGLPETVLRRAEQYLLLSGEDSSALVERLNSLAVDRETEIAGLREEKRSFAQKRKELQASLEKERARLLDSLQAESQKVLRDWKSSKISHKQALKELSRLKQSLAGSSETGETPAEAPEIDLSSLTPRQRVWHLPWKRAGILLEVDTRKKRARLDFDGVSLWADAKDIALTESVSGFSGAAGRSRPVAKAVPSGSSSGNSGNAGAAAGVLPLRLDLRGLRADVAVSDLEKFLDRAILGGREAVEVIHGRGTGALRREVHAFLRNFPVVRDFQLANEEQGGDGMTIVSLR